MTIKVIKAPDALPYHRSKGVIPKSVFLAGSIEMGAAEDWQAKLTKHFEQDFGSFKTTYYLFNPRREKWDSTWVQSIDNPQFNEQVSWELTALDCAKYIYMYFDPNTKSPISLLELGLYAHSKKIIVCCPHGFYRRGNVEIVCERYNIPFYSDFDRSVLHITDAI